MLNLDSRKGLESISSVDLEETVLKTVILFPELLPEAREHITDSSVFYNTINKVLWEELCGIVEGKGTNPVDSVEVEQTLLHNVRGHSTSEFFDYRSALTNIMDQGSATAIGIETVCKALVDTFYRRKVYGILEEGMGALMGAGDLPSILGSLESELYQIQQQRSGVTKDWRVKSGETAQEEYSGDIEAYLDAVDVSTKTGLLDLDEITLGLRPKTMSVWGGRPAMGKSAIAGYVANSIALQNKPVIFFSMEMSALDLDLRRISLLTKIDGQKFLRKTLAPGERQFSIEMWEWMKGSPLYYDENPRSTPQTIRSTLRHYMAKHGHIGAFVVDYLQLMGESSGNRNNEVEQITRELKALSIEFNTHCICLSQISRGVESRSNKRPILSDLRDSGGIEQNADLIVFLYRDEYYNSESEDRNITELIVAKNRRSKVGTAKVLTQLEYSNYENLAE